MLYFKFAAFKCSLDDYLKLGKIQRLCEEIVGSVLHGLYCGINGTVAGKNDDRNSRHLGCYLAQNLFA